MKKTRYTRKYAQVLTALRQHRKQAGLTQKEVAKKFDSHASFISKIESGERRIDVVELAEFCKIYGVSLSEFVSEAGLD